MKSSRVIIVFTVLVMIFICACSTLSREKEKEAADESVTVANILKKAECPLTKDQTKTLTELDLSEGREVFQTLYGMFDEKQTEALKNALGVRPGRNDRPDSPRYLMQVVIFEKGECPLTENQLEALKALPNERGSWEKAREIYTEKQSEEMGKIFQRNR